MSCDGIQNGSVIDFQEQKKKRDRQLNILTLENKAKQKSHAMGRVKLHTCVARP